MSFKPLFLVLFFGLVQTFVGAQNATFERLDRNNSLLLVVDHQIGLFQIVRDYQPDEYKNNIFAHAALGKVFDIPTILTTSAEHGPNGPLPHEITDMHPNAPFIKRNGEVNAWDNADFREAVRATGKKQIILAGIVTDVCTTFLALSLIEEGYSVWANAEASGAASRRIADEANDRMRAAGVQVVSMFSIACDLMRDWRNTPGAEQLLPYFDQYFSVYGMLARGHQAAVTSGEVQPGEPSP
ncbi:Isochorismatase hydrolase [Dendrothele bispora CBS 962.96]|uniref:Isochorismatase hydrolase n=1 Tax=Dendrothele bispora (strain CBS 962.96) TaxID=1314807 RepID=A0A4S8KYE9_DENBC|nr:Isochorismatase hydrolase [Dendrothele bispora CBS 962.96]